VSKYILKQRIHCHFHVLVEVVVY